MNFRFNKKDKEKLVGVRLNLKDWNELNEIAKNEKATLAEIIRVFIEEAKEEYNNLDK